MKQLQACAGEETHTIWARAIKRLIHSYLEHRSERRALRRCNAENKIVSPCEGRRWCDETERELLGKMTNIHGPHLRTVQPSLRTGICAPLGKLKGLIMTIARTGGETP